MKKLLLVFLLNAIFCIRLMASIPPGYYDAANNLTGQQLKTSLCHIIKNHTVISYANLWTAYYVTDAKPNGTVWDMYSDIPDGTANGNPPYVYIFGTHQCGNAPGYENGCYNREHSFPKSWSNTGTGDTIYSDLFHLYPTDSYVNGQRNNYPFGEVDNPTWTSMNGSKLGNCSITGYSGVVFEPRDDFKGDFARTFFYIATRYEKSMAAWQNNDANGNAVLNGTSFPCYETWFINMLLAWNVADPVSQKEIDRNNVVYTNYQHNRNPFIDHPEYANAIWAPNAGVKPEPTNHASDFSSHNIQLQWTDAANGNLPDGYLIRISSVGFNNIAVPLDGIPVNDSPNDKNVPFGNQNAIFTGLTPNTTYYIKMFPYIGSGNLINYKTDGAIPQMETTTNP
jgi:endonuclease I